MQSLLQEQAGGTRGEALGVLGGWAARGSSTWHLPHSTGHSATSLSPGAAKRAYESPLVCPGVSSSSSKMPGECAEVTAQAKGMKIDPKRNSPLSGERLRYVFFQLHDPRENIATLMDAIPTDSSLFLLGLCLRT